MGCVVTQPLAFVQCLVDESDLTLLQIPKSAVHELGGFRGGAGGEVVPFDQRGSQAAGGSIEGASDSGDAATDDDHIEGGLTQSAQGIVSVEGGGVHGAGAYVGCS